MAMSLRVVVPPHPLIGHWLAMLRHRETPSALYATAMQELGRWLTYEALGSVVLAASSPHRPRGGALGTHGCHAAPRNLCKR